MIWMDMDQEKMNQQEATAAEGVTLTGGDVSATLSLSSNQSLPWKSKTRSRRRSRSRSSSFSKPSWLLSTIADLDERTKMLALKSNRSTRDKEEEEEAGDSFAERAEDYYLKRPQLLSLLQDLYNGYLSLADRYCQTLAKHQHSFQSTAVNFEEMVESYEEEEEKENDHEPLGVDSDAESSLSYQVPIIFNPITTTTLDGDAIVAELVMKAVDYDILVNEMSVMERWWGECWKKTELQKSLVEVLESERLILLNENARLGYKVTALVEENRGMAAETLFMKRKAAGELARRRCVLEMREDHRVCMLSRKIEDLQGQIYGLETRNKEYYDQLVKRDNRHYQGGGSEKAKKGKSKSKKKKKKKSKKGGGGEVTLEDCFQVNGEEEGGGSSSSSSSSSTGTAVGSSTQKKKKGLVDHRVGGGGRKVVSKWWDRVKNFDLFLCGGPHNPPNFTFC